MDKKKIRRIAAKKAPSAAEALCVTSCNCGFNCGRPHDNRGEQPSTEPLQQCPIAKYGQAAREATTADWLALFQPFAPGAFKVDAQDIFYLCADCEYGELVEDENGECVDIRPKQAGACLGCPVARAEAVLMETAGETAYF